MKTASADSYQNKRRFPQASVMTTDAVPLNDSSGIFSRRRIWNCDSSAVSIACLCVVCLIFLSVISFYRESFFMATRHRHSSYTNFHIMDGRFPSSLRQQQPVVPQYSLAKNRDGDNLLDIAKQTGIDIENDGGAIVWKVIHGGKIKPVGPLKDKKVAVVLASEFSDFQVYYLASYIGEFGGICEFLLVDWVKWKFTRPNVADKGVRGMWDISLDPMPVMAGSDKASNYKGLRSANPKGYDAVIVVGGHSADVLTTETEVIEFIKAADENGSILGSIGAGSMPFITAGIIQGKTCTGNRLVEYMLKKIANFEPGPVETDGNLITARDTSDTPAFVRELARKLDPNFVDEWKGTMSNKKVMLLIGEDYEDIEVIVPVLEWIHRGASVLIGYFKPQFTSRAPHSYLDFAVGNFGTTIPFQEIPDSLYSMKPLDDVSMDDFDVVVITGAFNPWNMVATGVIEWLRKAHAAGKFIAAICHGPIAVAAVDLVEGKKVTGWLASKDSVEIMGGTFNSDDWAAVIDGRLISARTPPELPEFIDAVNVALSL